MIGTIDLAVIGLSVLCAVGSTLTYLYFQRKLRGRPRPGDAEESHNATAAQAHTQMKQSEESVQRTWQELNAAVAQARKQKSLEILGQFRQG
jgi:hypothetical protein